MTKLYECKEEGVALIVLSCFDDPDNWQESICKQYELWTGNPAPNKPPLSYDQVLELISRDQMEGLRIKFLRNFI